jgi:uncharacterized membrane protein YczE
MGTDPLDVFCLGVQKQFGLKIGTTQSIFAIVCLLVWSAMKNWRVPPFSTWLTFFLCGYMIDYMRYLAEGWEVNKTVSLISGVILCLQGSAGIILSGFGIRAMDLVAIAAEELHGVKFWITKAMFETALLLVGWLMGGPVGIGTICFLVVVGYLIKPMVVLSQKVFPLDR